MGTTLFPCMNFLNAQYRKQCWSLDLEQRYPNCLQILFYFSLFSPNQENCIEVDAKCLVFLQFSQQTLVFVSKVSKTLYQSFTMPHYCRGPYQALIFSSCPHHLLLVFWELILGYVTPLDWYVDFLMVRLYPKHPSILILHFSNCDMN